MPNSGGKRRGGSRKKTSGEEQELLIAKSGSGTAIDTETGDDDYDKIIHTDIDVDVEEDPEMIETEGATAAASTSDTRTPAMIATDDMNPEDYLLFVQTVQGQAMRTLIEAIELLLPEENFEFDKDGMKMMAMDATQSLIIHLKLYAERFETYYCKRPVTVGLSIFNLLKVMKIIGNVHTLTLYMEDDDETHLYIRIENPDKNIVDLFKVNLLDISRRRFAVPDEQFQSVITMPSADFQKFCRDMSHIGDIVDIQSVGDTLKMTVEGDFAEQTKTFGQSSGCVNILQSNEQEIIQGKFSLRCLVSFSRCTNLCNNIEMYLKNDFPLIIRYQVANLGFIKLALAPRVG
jgi:proliferating cell nuclear antigen